MYPMVELATGLLFLACYLVFGLNAEALKWAIFAALMIVLTITDFRERILPDKVNFVGLGLGLLLSLFTRPVDGTAPWLANHLFAYPPPEPVLSLADALIGAGVASGLLWLVAEGYFRARGREGMGFGDVKMMAMAGAFLGVQRALLTILLGSSAGKPDWHGRDRHRAQGTRFRAAVWNFSGSRGNPGGLLWLARSRLVPRVRTCLIAAAADLRRSLGVSARDRRCAWGGRPQDSCLCSSSSRPRRWRFSSFDAAFAPGDRRKRPKSPLPKPSMDNPSAFMTASMQAVIQKLREQEKELAALHRRDRERAQQTERLSEAVTRNMPAGLLLISSAGIDYQRQSGGGSRARRACASLPPLRRSVWQGIGAHQASGHVAWRTGAPFGARRSSTQPRSGELRQLGVTISPILGRSSRVTGALCLLSDLTELAALQRQVQVKENLAALGELSAGIAHEFKNALATISGYAQMIRSESKGETAENAQLSSSKPGP